MKIEEISKVFLISFKDIPRMIKSLDRCIEHAVKSGFGCSHLYNGITTDMLYEKIIVFKNRQDILATIREVTKDILRRMDSKNTTILVEKYVQHQTVNQIANKHNISVRSTFRYLNKALNEFSYYLRVKGYGDDEWFRGELFLENVYAFLSDFEKADNNALKNYQVKSESKTICKVNSIENTNSDCKTEKDKLDSYNRPTNDKKNEQKISSFVSVDNIDNLIFSSQIASSAVITG